VTLSAEELLAGSSLTYEVTIPPGVLAPADGRALPAGAASVTLRPLTVRDLQLVTRAARDSDTLVATLMVQRALVAPEMTVAQVAGLHVGLVQFLLHEVNRLSGITATAAELNEVSEAPIARAAFVLTREFGWTPQQVNELTLGQVLLHLQMLRDKTEP
jgi:hypothetical protein